MKKIAVLTSGGDSQGMNAYLVKLMQIYKYREDVSLYAIIEGYKGLLENHFCEIEEYVKPSDFSRGGSVILTSRCPEFATKEGKEKAVEILKENEIDTLIVVGGNGSLAGAYDLMEMGIDVIGVPASIDNDMFYSSNSLGFNTAVMNAVESINKIRDSAVSNRKILIAEVMGRDCGNIALKTAIATNADFVITKETINKNLDINKIKLKKSPLIVVAENLLDVKKFSSTLQENLNKISQAQIIGHVQRGGEASVTDKILATKFAFKTKELIDGNKVNLVLGTENELDVKTFKLKNIKDKKDNFDFELFNLIYGEKCL